MEFGEVASNGVSSLVQVAEGEYVLVVEPDVEVEAWQEILQSVPVGGVLVDEYFDDFSLHHMVFRVIDVEAE